MEHRPRGAQTVSREHHPPRLATAPKKRKDTYQARPRAKPILEVSLTVRYGDPSFRSVRTVSDPTRSTGPPPDTA